MKRYSFHTKPLGLEIKVFAIKDAKGEYIKLDDSEKVYTQEEIENLKSKYFGLGREDANKEFKDMLNELIEVKED